MSGLHRRRFLGSSLGGFAAALTFGSGAFGPGPFTSGLFGQEAGAEGAAFDPDTLFLSWQRDPTTTMTIQWVGPKSSAGTAIQFAPLQGDVWQSARTTVKPYPNTDEVVSRCELTGLASGSEYQFQIGMNSPRYRFRTMPARATDTIQFVSGGDSGVDEHAISTNKLAARQEPYFALIAGDLAYDNGRSPETFSQFLRNYKSQMVDPQGRLIPMLSCIGNHEVNGSYKCDRDKSPQYLSVFDGLFPEKTYGVIDIGDYLSLVLLDTDHVEPIEGEQTAWLARTLADRQERPHLIVANHVPAYPSYRAPVGDSGEPGTGHMQRIHWSPLFEKYKVDAVLEHHDHTFKRTHPLTDGIVDKNGVLYLGDGSWGKLRIPKTPEQRPYLAKVSSAYHVTVHRLEGDRRFHVALEETGRVADVCSTVSKRPSA